MMSKREEERHEKIIRGLMKLPPNRRCINCNSLGPQYVCINFWTFVCMTCSGIHREFTHRVKSVSMSKFTSDEVEALQNGGNQRAREMYLKDWDMQRQRLPNSSDAERVREFIKTSLDISVEKETRRASSYHSFSQSPPYDFQYEDRQNRKHGAALTRKPGSDRGIYDRKVSSFVYSPGGSSEQFANEGSGSRASDFSLSSGGDQFRSSPQSPNFQKDSGYNSPTIDPTSGRVLAAHVKKDTCAVPHPQRTKSSGSLGLVDGHSQVLKPASSGISPSFLPESEQSVTVHHIKPAGVSHINSVDSPSFSFASASSSGAEPVVAHPNYSAQSVDLFQFPAVEAVGANSNQSALPVGADFNHSAQPVDLFQFPAVEAVGATNLFPSPLDSSAPLSSYASQSSGSSLTNFFSETVQNPSNMKIHETLPPLPAQNQGWATFDLPQHAASVQYRHEFTMDGVPLVENSNELFHPPQTSSYSQWTEPQSSMAHSSHPLLSNMWPESALNIPAAIDSASSQNTSAIGFQETASGGGNPMPTVMYHETAATSYTHVLHPLSEGHPRVDYKPGNPFDVAYDSVFEANDGFLDMSSLAAAMPDTQLPSSFIGGINESWFPPNTPNSFLGVASQSGFSYMSAQATSTNLQNVPANGPVASLGGNPFA
ncbi:putative ADP-ribosylation factor GTPase-activating protein AGD14 [Drosera capensis]